MNQALNCLLTRRSVRSYLPKPVPQELLSQILEAGTYAPSGMGRQSAIILAVTDPDTRNRLSALNASVMGRDGDPFYGAPVVLTVLADRTIPTYLYDGSLVMQNLMLAAHALGLGSCWIHRAREVFDMPQGRELLASLGIRGNYEGIGNCILGYPAQEAPLPKPRKQDFIYRI